ncbi:MAG: hypothetical protein ACI837_002335 [Crocinitomicaceae bacterium]|jgi:hypothetical protein
MENTSTTALTIESQDKRSGKFQLLLLFIILNSFVYGQFTVAPKLTYKLTTGKFKEENLEKLKSTTTIVVYGNKEKESLDSIKLYLQAAWHLTKLEFVSVDDFDAANYDGTYSFLTIRSAAFEKSSSDPMDTMTSKYVRVGLDLWMNDGDTQLFFGRMILFPTHSTWSALYSKRKKETLEYCYGKADFNLWSPGYIKSFLQVLEVKLNAREEISIFKSEKYADISSLTNDTLYVPDFVRTKYNRTLKGLNIDERSVDELSGTYKYPIKFISKSEMSDLILSSKTSFMYLIYAISSSDKFVSIIDGQTGELMDANYTKGTNFMRSDLTRISKRIKSDAKKLKKKAK